MTQIHEMCMSVKSKHEIDVQCPHTQKIGDYCGIHHKSKNVIRIDGNSDASRINVNITFKKPDKEENSSEFYDDLKYLSKLPESSINYAKLVKTLRYFQIQIQGTKYQLLKLLEDYIKNQELLRNAYDDQSICNNTNDFYDFVDLQDIPKEYLFIFVCEDGKLYGMDLRSMFTFFRELEKDCKLMENPVEYRNPYNRCRLTAQTICTYRNRIKNLQEANKPVTYPEEVHEPEDKMTFKVVEVFHTINNYGYSVDASWFLKMSKADLLDYYIVMEDIWNHRMNITLATKRSVVPDNLNIFNRAEYYDIRELDLLKLQNFLINKIEKMINSGVDRSSRVLGIHYCLIGLCEVCDIGPNTPFN